MANATPSSVLVLDVGKTNSKLSLWAESGTLLEVRSRPNQTVLGAAGAVLDTAGVERWLQQTLPELSRRARVSAVVPVAHGAACAVMRGDDLVTPPVSYEEPMPVELRKVYDRIRDPFAATGSPRLPDGLNLGAQLFRAQLLAPELLPVDAQLVPLPQYFAQRLCGERATEVTSLGCHSDLWRPFERRFSDLAVERGWAERFAPLRGAQAVLGTARASWGLPRDCEVLCGAHDSNAALHGARAHRELAQRDLSVVSTGTWFVAMRVPARREDVDLSHLREDRDTLVNVDVAGEPVPSARFMGGREIERALAGVGSPGDANVAQGDVPRLLEQVLAREALLVPSFAPGVGPFPNAQGRWVGPELSAEQRSVAASLYLALMTDVMLDLIGSRDAILIEGRFAEDPCFTRALATLRATCDVYLAPSSDALAYGALRLARPQLAPSAGPTRAKPLERDLTAYAALFREHAAIKHR